MNGIDLGEEPKKKKIQIVGIEENCQSWLQTLQYLKDTLYGIKVQFFFVFFFAHLKTSQVVTISYFFTCEHILRTFFVFAYFSYTLKMYQ